MVSLPGVAFEAPAGFPQQFRRHGQIALGRSDMQMAEIGCQLWQEVLHIGALLVPRNHAMHREGDGAGREAWAENGTRQHASRRHGRAAVGTYPPRFVASG